MPFYDLVEKIQQKNLGKLCVFRVGFFYSTFGLQSFVVEEKLNLTRVCFIQNEICKAGVPISVFEKYVQMLKKTNISFCVFDYTSDLDYEFEYNDKKYRKTLEYIGQDIDTSSFKIECSKCKFRKTNIYSKLDMLEHMLCDIKINNY